MHSPICLCGMHQENFTLIQDVHPATRSSIYTHTHYKKLHNNLDSYVYQLNVTFTRAAHEPDHNNSCGPMSE